MTSIALSIRGEGSSSVALLKVSSLKGFLESFSCSDVRAQIVKFVILGYSKIMFIARKKYGCAISFPDI